MATRSSRGRRSRRSTTTTTADAASANGAEPAAEAAAEPAPKKPAAKKTAVKKTMPHVTHHQRVARNLNALVENFGELRKQVVETERAYKRADKNLDTLLFQVRTRLDAAETRLNEFIDEMTGAAFENSQHVQGNAARIEAVWDALAALSSDPADVEQRRKACEEREAARRAELDERLTALAGKSKPAAARAASKPAAARTRRKSAA